MKMRELAPMSNQDNADITAAKMVAIRQAAEQGDVDAQYSIGLVERGR